MLPRLATTAAALLGLAGTAVAQAPTDRTPPAPLESGGTEVPNVSPGDRYDPATSEVAPDAMEGPGASSPEANDTTGEVDRADVVETGASLLRLAADSRRLASVQAADPTIRSHADQTSERFSEAARRLAEAGGLAGGAALIQGHELRLQALASKTGRTFDVDYLALQRQLLGQIDQIFADYARTAEDRQVAAAAGEAARVAAEDRQPLAALGR